jgi:hypothetical protein
MILTTLLIACPADRPPGETGEVTDDPTDNIFELTDAHNYAYTSDVSIGEVEVQTAQDVTFDWSGLTTDIQTHAVDPATIEQSFILWFEALTHAEVEAKIGADDIDASDVGAILIWDNDAGATSNLLSEHLVYGSAAFDPTTDFTAEEGSWLFRLVTDTVNSRMVTFLNPTSSSDNHTVTVGDDSAAVDFDADLSSLEPYGQEASFDTYEVRWSTLETTGGGQDFDPAKIDQVMLAYYSESVAEIEADFLNVEQIADEEYLWEVSQAESLEIASADFGGFRSGVWLIALRCTACASPAPHFLSVIDVP